MPVNLTFGIYLMFRGSNAVMPVVEIAQLVCYGARVMRALGHSRCCLVFVLLLDRYGRKPTE
jgi:hypothetical protein